MKVVIMQGVPGSGKTFHGRQIAMELGGDLWEADQYPGLYERNEDGSIKFNMNLLGRAHGACLRGAIGSLLEGRSVVIGNTNTTQLEVAPYVALAQAFGAEPVIVRVECEPRLAFSRNEHGVPRDAFDAMVRRLSEFKPAPHWRWIPGFKMEVK